MKTPIKCLFIAVIQKYERLPGSFCCDVPTTETEGRILILLGVTSSTYLILDRLKSRFVRAFLKEDEFVSTVVFL